MAREARIGPWLVAIGAALWGTESAWRIPLGETLSADVLVFWEHAILVLLAIPLIVPRLHELRGVRRTTIAWLVFSGVAGSAVGTVLFTLALQHGNKTVIQVVLNIQPLLSTTAAVVLFGDRLGRSFVPWAIVAIGAGMVLVGLAPGVSLSFNEGIIYALVCALAWGISTVAGRAVMTELSTPLASGLRVVIGLACMTIIVAVRGQLAPSALWPAAADGQTVLWLVLLSTLSGGLPLLIYFKGLQLTRASTAGYFEMMQTLAGVAVTWGWYHEALERYQVIAAIVLIGAVAMVQRAQDSVSAESPSVGR